MSAPAAALYHPLLDDAELAALIARGHRLARSPRDVAVDAGRRGGSPSNHFGDGLDFAEHRHYQPGDDPRRMDWRVTARIGQPHVRRYHDDLVAEGLILVDRRASMRFATRGRLKASQAVRLAILLAAWHSGRQVPVTVFELDTALHRHGPLGDAQLPALGHHLARPCPPSGAPGASLNEALVALARQATPGCRLWLLSDLADTDAVAPALWHRLAQRHRVRAIRISDPAERQPPAASDADLCWPDAAGTRLPLTAAVAERLASHAQAGDDTLTARLGQAGIPLAELWTTEADPLTALRGRP